MAEDIKIETGTICDNCENLCIIASTHFATFKNNTAAYCTVSPLKPEEVPIDHSGSFKATPYMIGPFRYEDFFMMNYHRCWKIRKDDKNCEKFEDLKGERLKPVKPSLFDRLIESTERFHLNQYYLYWRNKCEEIIARDEEMKND